jgi:hypothetical protein
MADSELDYSTSAGLNTDINGISVAEGIPPANLNDAIRNMAKLRYDATTHRVNKAAGSYNPVKADHNQFWLCTGVATITLPATIPADGWILWVKAAGGDCAISVSGGGTLTGSDPYTLLDGATIQIIATNFSGVERYDIISSNATAGTITTGTYTPTLTNVSGVASSTMAICNYIRVGNTVLVTGNIAIDPVDASGVLFDLSLPIASNITLSTDASGVITGSAGGASGYIDGDAANNRINCNLATTNTGNQQVAFTFSYRII